MEMREQKTTNELMRELKTSIMNRAVNFLCSKSNNDAGEEEEDESRVNFNHNTILRMGNNVLQRKNIFDEIEEDFNLPTLGIKLVNKLGRKVGIKDVGDIKTPLLLMKESNKAQIVLESGLFGLGELHSEINGAKRNGGVKKITNFREA